MLLSSVQCSEDLSNSRSSSSASVFYASGNRLFKCSATYDVNRGDNRIVSCSAEVSSSANDAAVGADADINVLDRICPYCNQLIAGSVSQADYERHLQSHLDSDVDDDVVTV